jgi:hypothetical protein
LAIHNIADIGRIIEDYKKVMVWATPEDAELIDVTFWGSHYLPPHIPIANTIVARARAAILEKAKNGKAESDKGSEGPQKSAAAKRT